LFTARSKLLFVGSLAAGKQSLLSQVKTSSSSNNNNNNNNHSNNNNSNNQPTAPQL
jgi:hypothetical protein